MGARRHRAFQPLQHRGAAALGKHRLRRRAAPAVHVQQYIQLGQPGGFVPQLLLLGEGLTHLCLGGGLLLVEVVQLVLHRFQPLGHLTERIVDTGEISTGVCAQRRPVGHLAFQQEHILLPESVKRHRHSEAPVTAHRHRVGL